MPLLFEELNLKSEKNKEPINSFFYENGYEETFLLGNLGSTLVYIVLFIIMLLFQLMLRLCGSYSKHINTFSQYYERLFNLSLMGFFS
jgi:hypothetical protein